MKLIPLLVLATLVAVGCQELGQVAGPIGAPSPFAPEFSVVVFGVTDVGVPLGGDHARAMAVNDLGEVVGSSFTVTSPSPNAFHWANGSVRNLGTLVGHTFSEARDVNSRGQVVGMSGTFGGESQAVLWESGTIAALPTADVGVLGVVEGQEANAINDLGQIVGRGRVTVAILTSPYFNAAGIDPATLTLGNDDGLDTPIARKKKLIPAAKLYDVDRDGDADLVTEFEVSQLLANGDLTPATTRLVLLGMLRNGKHIRGSAAVSVQ